MKIDVPTVNLLKVRSETERLLRVLLKTEGSVNLLSEKDPVFRFLAENSRGRKGYLMKMRDILDEAVLVETEGSYVFLLGLEAQSEPEPSMAARIHLYDALAIMHQYEKEVHDKLGDVVFMSKDRFEKAFPLGMSLKPMKSFIIYTGIEEMVRTKKCS